MTDKQARQPKGIPVGGRFATGAKDESGDLTPGYLSPWGNPYGESIKDGPGMDTTTADYVVMDDTDKPRSARIAAALRLTTTAYPYLSTRVSYLCKIDEVEGEWLNPEHKGYSAYPRADRLRNRHTGKEMTVESPYHRTDFHGGLEDKVRKAATDPETYAELSEFFGADMVDAYVHGKYPSPA